MARAEEQVGWERPARAESPWGRAIKAILRKLVALVCLVTIFVLYGAGIYTFLDAFGIDTGLQDPNATNLSERRSTRETDGQGELIGTFVDRVGADLEKLNKLNPHVVEEYGSSRVRRGSLPGQS